MRAPTAEERTAMYQHSNKEWYRFDEENNCYELTDKAPEKAKESFKLDCRRRKERLKKGDN